MIAPQNEPDDLGMDNESTDHSAADYLPNDVVDKTWRMLDRRIDVNELEELTTQLATSSTARRAYISAIRMHFDLLELASEGS